MTRRATILLVEDNPDDVELTLRAFENTSVANDIVVTRNGVDALDYVFCTGPHCDRDASQRPRVVLLDVKLPGIDGLEVLRRVRSDQRTRDLPVVMLTSSQEESDIRRSYDLGANSFIRKPVDFEEFLTALCQLERYWLGLNIPPPASGAR
jgi:two-component system response regulator